MDKPFAKRRPSSGPNTGLKRRKSNTVGDSIYGSINISNNLLRQKPGIQPQALSYGPECGTAGPTTMQAIRQSYERSGYSGDLISKTTLDALRQFRSTRPETPNGEELKSEHPNIRHGYCSDTSGKSENEHNDKFITSYDTSFPAEFDSSYSNGPVGSPGNTTRNKQETNIHRVDLGSSTSNGAIRSSPFPSRALGYYEPTEAPNPEPDCPCPALDCQNKPENITGDFQTSERRGCFLPNLTPWNAQETSEDGSGFCDDDMDETGLVALAEAYDQTDSGAEGFAINPTLGKRASPEAIVLESPVKELEGTISSYYRRLGSVDEYGIGSEYFNHSTKDAPEDLSSDICPDGSLPGRDSRGHDKAPANQLQDNVPENEVAKNSPLPQFPVNILESAESASPYQQYQEEERTNPSLVLGDSRSTSLHGNQDLQVVESNIQPKGASQFIPTGGSAETQNSNSANLHPLQPSLRHAFPSPVRDRSHIQGLSSHTVLRTCFRIAEALKAVFPSLSTANEATVPRTTLIELYAIVTASYYWNNTQFFTFADLFFPDRPPHLRGKWVGGTFENNTPRRNDSDAKEGEIGSLCRVLGIIGTACGGNKGDSSNGPNATTPLMKDVTMMVFGVWQVDWDHIEYVRGIVEA